MDTAKIHEVVARYRQRLEEMGIPKERMDIGLSLGDLTREQRLAHAHFLLDGVVEFANISGKEGKTGRHLASVQMILSFEKLYTVKQLMEHNRPDARA